MAGNSFLRIPGVHGDSKGRGHNGWFDVAAWDLKPHSSAPSITGGNGATAANVLHCMVDVGNDAGKLLRVNQRGRSFRGVILDAYKGEIPVAQFRFDDAVISTFVFSIAMFPSSGLNYMAITYKSYELLLPGWNGRGSEESPHFHRLRHHADQYHIVGAT